MKNIVTKLGLYKNYGFFNHVYFLDCDYPLNEKTLEDVVEFIVKEPFFDIMIHANDLSVDVIETIKCLSKIRTIVFQSDEILFEDFATMDKETMNVFGIDNINVMIDALGDTINLKDSIREKKLVKYDYFNLPF